MVSKMHRKTIEEEIVATLRNLALSHKNSAQFSLTKHSIAQSNQRQGLDLSGLENQQTASFQSHFFNKIQVEFTTDLDDNFFSWNYESIRLEANKSVLIRLCDPISNLGNPSNSTQETELFKNKIWSTNLDLAKVKANKPESNATYESNLLGYIQNSASKSPISDYKNYLRANADMACCYLMFHDFNLHQAENFNDEEQKIFDEFEKVRVIANACDTYLGIAKNLFMKLNFDLELRNQNSVALLLFLLVPTATNLVFHFKILDQFLKNLSAKLPQKIQTKLQEIAQYVGNQAQFAHKVAELLELIRNPLPEMPENNSQNSKKEDSNQEAEGFGTENIEQQIAETQDLDEEENSKIEQFSEEKIAEFEINQSSDSKPDSNTLDSTFRTSDEVKFKEIYKIYTSKFDELIFPQKFIKKNELEVLCDQLDIKLSKLSNISNKMALQLKKKLISKRNNNQKNNNSAGILNRKILSRFIIKASSEGIWQHNQLQEYQNTALTILIDNSGSMRGNPIIMSAMACKIIAEILEKFSIKTEIIGFTTADWRGGRVRKNWELAGKPQNPGRLNELRHIIYKQFNHSFRRSRINLGLMLKEGILKENIDGEALLFAKGRLLQQSAKRKILLVISDGNPVDDSTNSSNQGDILSEHLRHVIARIEKQSTIELIGIGIGHSTSDFYRNAISIKNLEDLGDVMIKKIAEIL